MNAHIRHLNQAKQVESCETTIAMNRLIGLRRNSRHEGNHNRAEAIQNSLDSLIRLIFARHTELRERSHEFFSASRSPGSPVTDRETLEGWLQARADEAGNTGTLRLYFTQLAQQLRSGRDPWTVSRELMRSLPGAGDEQQAKRLKEAHDHLVQAMVAGSLRPATASPPGIAQDTGASGDLVSLQQGMVERLNSRNPLLVWQVQIIMSAVKRAKNPEALGMLTSPPESGAKSLLDRVQSSVGRPLDWMSESERETESADLKALGELIEQLDSLDCL